MRRPTRSLLIALLVCVSLGALAFQAEGTVYRGDPSHRAAVEDAYRAVFTGDLPARTMVGTGLIVPEGLMEIMLTAVK